MPVSPGILFRVAGGPRTGFGHVVRALSLSKALRDGAGQPAVPPLTSRGAAKTRGFRVAAWRTTAAGHGNAAAAASGDAAALPQLSVRGTAATQAAVRRLGAQVDARPLARALRRRDLRLLVVDDPNPRAAAAALAAGRRRGIPVASLHDLGIAAIASDLAIDGSLAQPRRSWPAPNRLTGSQYAVLDPTVPGLARAHAQPARRPSRASRTAADVHGTLRVLVSLGGGRRGVAAFRIARAIADAYPDVAVTLATGFVPRRDAEGREAAADVSRLQRTSDASSWAAGSASPAVTRADDRRVRLLEPSTFRRQLAQSDLAVLAGGVSLYEAAAFGVPAVAVAVVRAQRPTIRAFQREGVATDAGLLTTAGAADLARTIARIVGHVGDLLADADRRHAMSVAGQRVIDGRGALRVAAALRRLMTGEGTHAS